MPQIKHLEWDSQMLRAKAGEVEDYRKIPAATALAAYRFVHVRIPLEKTDYAWRYERAGFRIVTIDFTLAKEPVRPAQPDAGILTISKQEPDFEICGFTMVGSRLALDPAYRKRLKNDFWDRMIRNHCVSFADFALCAVDGGRLTGIVSCFDRSNALTMFLVIVHPKCRGTGVGKRLIRAAERRATETGKTKLTTNVVAQNFNAANFYFKNGFLIEQGHIIMHRAGT